MLKPTFRHRSARGFSLVEVLVTMAVSAVALLGLAGMQLQGARMQSVAGYRSTAALLASDLADRIRANPAGAASLTAYVFTNAYQSSAPIDPDCGTKCTSIQSAQRDLHEWWSRDASTQLPEPWIYVATSGSAYRITVLWREPDQESSAASNTAAAFTCPNAALTGVSTSVSVTGVRCYSIEVWP